MSYRPQKTFLAGWSPEDSPECQSKVWTIILTGEGAGIRQWMIKLLHVYNTERSLRLLSGRASHFCVQTNPEHRNWCFKMTDVFLNTRRRLWLRRLPPLLAQERPGKSNQNMQENTKLLCLFSLHSEIKNAPQQLFV